LSYLPEASTMMDGRCGEMRLDKIKQGLEGENIIRDILHKNHIHYFQADLMVKVKSSWQIWEVKHQEMFEAPPFNGHGLPEWQLNARLEFQRETGIRAVLLVVDSVSNIVYWQYMDELAKSPRFQTKGKSPRIVFPLESYRQFRLSK